MTTFLQPNQQITDNACLQGQKRTTIMRSLQEAATAEEQEAIAALGAFLYLPPQELLEYIEKSDIVLGTTWKPPLED